MAAEAGPATSSECSICCEEYNGSTRSCITCDYGDCLYSACKSCVRQYLLGTAENPHCMNCKKAWPQNFVVMKLNRSFVTNEYKKHRRELLLERELSKMPETMVAASNYQKCLDEYAEIEKINKELAILREKFTEVSMKKNIHERRIHNLKNGKDDETEKRKFITPCSSSSCRGYLSTQYKCDLCKLYTCKDCLETIGYSKEDAHECDENNVKSAETIKKDTKPCPSCGVRIFKIVGCDQMWCTECHTAFSWKSGLKDTGVVHNPHFYQYQASINNGSAPRNPEDVVCGGLPGFYNLRVLVLSRLNYNSDKDHEDLYITITKIHRLINDITHDKLRNIRQKVRNYENTEQLRVYYILNKSTKEELSLQIYRNDNLRKKYMELVHIYELLSVVGIEMFNEFCSDTNKKTAIYTFIKMLKDKIKEYEILCDYCNKQMKTISITYNQTVPQILPNWDIETNKFTLTGVKTKKTDNKETGVE